jgi:transposase-like protein
MYMAKVISQEIKNSVLSAIKNGARVSDAANQFNVSVKSIYKWLRSETDNTGTSSLELQRLRRENAELKEIIGLFALEKKRAEKNR